MACFTPWTTEAEVDVTCNTVFMHDRAGTRALPEDLINVDDVISAYYDIVPDPTDVGQRVAFGTSGHRGASLDGKFNEAHIIAITAAIIEYRASQGIKTSRKL